MERYGANVKYSQHEQKYTRERERERELGFSDVAVGFGAYVETKRKRKEKKKSEKPFVLPCTSHTSAPFPLASTTGTGS